MKLQDFTKLTGLDLDALDTDTLRSLVSAQGQTLNRRISNIKYNPDASQIPVKSIMNSGGRFTTRSHYRKSPHGKPVPMTRKELLTEAKREINFAKKPYSTVKGAKALKEANQRIGGGQTAKEYAKEKQKEARAKVREQIYAENRAAGRRANKYTPAQKNAMKQAGKQAYKEAKKAYDDAVSDYWDSYEKYKEEHDFTMQSPKEIAEEVSSWSFKSDEEIKSHFEEILNKYTEAKAKEIVEEGKEDSYDPFTLVDHKETEEERMVKELYESWDESGQYFK